MVRQLITGALKECFGVINTAFVVEHPGDLAHGDYATSVALAVSKQLGKNPKEIADALAAYMLEHKDASIVSVAVAGPGFINITFDRASFVRGIGEAIDAGVKWGSNAMFADKNIVIEHSSPNLFKPFHIGHLMNNTVGESFVRLAHAAGAAVTTLSFPSDISLGVAKALYILLEKYGADFVPTDVATLGDAYVEGVKKYDDDLPAQAGVSIQSHIKEIADNLYAGTPSPEFDLFSRCKAFNISYFESTVAKLGSQFDAYIYESEAGVAGKKLVLANTPAVFTESEGAIVYMPDESKKLHTAVFINSQHNPTYEAKDIGLLEMKFDRYKPDISIVVTDTQQASHFAVVVDAAGKINPIWETNSVHRSHGRMTFRGAKMSSRLGGVPLATDVLATVVGEVQEKNPDVAPDAAEMIGVAAIKVAILRAMAGKDINFDPDTSLSFEGDSGPYLQYTAVRAASLLAKGAAAGVTPSTDMPVAGTETLERLVARFPEIVMQSQTAWAPHHIVTYLFDLAQTFNSWYGQGKIIDETDATGSAYRLAVTGAVRQTIANGLQLLAIEVPTKM